MGNAQITWRTQRFGKNELPLTSNCIRPILTRSKISGQLMKTPQIWNHLMHEVRDYASAVSLFSHNARMYLVASSLLSTAVAVHTVLYNLYLLDLRYDEALVGQVNGLAALGVALGGLPAGMLYNRWRGRRCFLLATAGIGLSMALRSVVVSPWALLAG